ncbi:ATP-grasp domain-containing protein [Saccharospirillum impatiens]|uniref:ATP-grasp domain-containing protein n=1 Tax=Saccharospirillum impatiens TaxID=169438 RepID=UPI000423F2ED|nr:ATP-grasp domain-containing protein [Saccharospirillum impatiens]
MPINNLVILTHVVHDAVINGFIPAAVRLGCKVIILTDHAQEHRECLGRMNGSTLPQSLSESVIECDVFNSFSVLETLARERIQPDAVFSNSDHLQTQASLVAQYFSLPSKDWLTCYRAKNKAAMRERLQQHHLPSAWHHGLSNPADLDRLDLDFPCVVKPQEGVASMDVKLCANIGELRDFCMAFWQQRPARGLIVEQYLEGPLFSVETLGDSNRLAVVGGYETTLSAPPYFIETECVWNSDVDSDHVRQAVQQIKAFGIGFGACHSEFVLTEHGPRLVEINYRSIGDGCEFLLDRMAHFDWFESILCLYLGQPLADLEPVQGCALTRYIVATRSGVLHHVPDDFEQTSPIYVRLENLKSQGDDHRLAHSNKDYLAVLSAAADDKKTLLQAVNALTDQLCWEIA